ncbi:MAG: hypothetical protein AAFV90_16400 [Cyanobacteria bacterium J06634_5]
MTYIVNTLAITFNRQRLGNPQKKYPALGGSAGYTSCDRVILAIAQF